MKILHSIILMCCACSSTLLFANDKVEFIEVNVAQNACKNKNIGESVSMNYRGIVWNGTCEAQFYPHPKTLSLNGKDAELNSFCSKSLGTTSVNIEGVLYQGKCMLGFLAPRPL